MFLISRLTRRDMPRNTGTRPGVARGRMVRVRLFNGLDSETLSPQGWSADTIHWAIRRPEPHPFDVKFWKVIE